MREKKIFDIEITATVAEVNALLQLMDLGVKSGGLSFAAAAALWADKLQTAATIAEEKVPGDD
jgi:hypothetical protein